MPFITLGTSSQLQIVVPTIGSTSWADTMRTDTFLKIAEHLHTGAADGAQLGTGSFSADSVTGTKIRLANQEYLRSRNAAGSGDINIIKINASDKIELGVNVSAASIEDTITSLINTLATAVVLADNQSAVTTGVISLGTDESCTVKYRLVRNGVTQAGTLEFTDVETTPQETFVGTDVGVTFTVNAGDLEYATTSTGNTTSMTYVVIKE